MSEDTHRPPTEDLHGSAYGKTWAVSDDQSISQALSDILQAAIEEDRASEKHGILFYIANESRPIIITGQDVIRLGRESRDTTIHVDLNQYHGAELGVSRYHAEITFIDGQYFIKDMGSTNGTWVNNKQISPYRQVKLNDADSIRLGHFTMLVTFTAPGG